MEITLVYMYSLKIEVGRRLKQAREATGKTLVETCAEVPGLSPTRLSNWENGTRTADLQIVKKLAKIYLTGASYLMTLEDEPPDPRSTLLITLYRATDIRGQEAILRVAEMESKYTVILQLPPPADENKPPEQPQNPDS
ncbi:helix-turn-helix transcriptional regulator [Glaciimonas sp. Gout2]|uniref:helix-turn-helix domain-containing protein n=1 Tax=unclassified Glaciimonas TaxID=2644401 RepID=UPI002AB4C15E|nr:MULTISPECIES: helix-turn-helix transcriptional regulator [unclassified Glaciimonas]MDY7544720.1 helix-turn-helix transcriptional regulator [Glaciimonas sp. CA11.2]MEB0011982.1 helix-turn-helix transcriptional regulator [Glaciimonas sp. Cout2]MEB0082782.1 helix-turn-helix transcriptional regulator [Glaciimonas sp. Gout2]